MILACTAAAEAGKRLMAVVLHPEVIHAHGYASRKEAGCADAWADARVVGCRDGCWKADNGKQSSRSLDDEQKKASRLVGKGQVQKNSRANPKKQPLTSRQCLGEVIQRKSATQFDRIKQGRGIQEGQTHDKHEKSTSRE